MAGRGTEVGEEEPPAGTEHPTDLPESHEFHRGRQVVEREGTDGDVEGPVREGQRFRPVRVKRDPSGPPDQAVGGEGKDARVRIHPLISNALPVQRFQVARGSGRGQDRYIHFAGELSRGLGEVVLLLAVYHGKQLQDFLTVSVNEVLEAVEEDVIAKIRDSHSVLLRCR